MRSIAARLGISRNTVAKAVSADGPPSYVRAPQDSGIKAVEPAIRALLRENPRMPATVLAERVGWSGSPAWFRENVARIRPEFVNTQQIDPAVAGDGLGQDLLVGGFDEFVHEPGREGVFDPIALFRGSGAEPDEQVGFARSGVPDQA